MCVRKDVVRGLKWMSSHYRAQMVDSEGDATVIDPSVQERKKKSTILTGHERGIQAI